MQCELCLIILPLKEYDVSNLPFKGTWEWGRAGPDVCHTNCLPTLWLSSMTSESHNQCRIHPWLYSYTICFGSTQFPLLSRTNGHFLLISIYKLCYILILFACNVHVIWMSSGVVFHLIWVLQLGKWPLSNSCNRSDIQHRWIWGLLTSVVAVDLCK